MQTLTYCDGAEVTSTRTTVGSSASKLCEVMKRYEKLDKHLYTWLDAHFAGHEFVRKMMRPRNVSTWLGVKPCVLLERCNACGASCIPRLCVDVVG
jgi:hypothetical protein